MSSMPVRPEEVELSLETYWTPHLSSSQLLSVAQNIAPPFPHQYLTNDIHSDSLSVPGQIHKIQLQFCAGFFGPVISHQPKLSRMSPYCPALRTTYVHFIFPESL